MEVINLFFITKMFLKNYYEESEKTNRLRRKIIGLVALGLFAYIAFVIVLCSHQPTQKDIEQTISQSAKLRELDLFCRELPKPADFKYKFKTLGGNSRKASIGFWYQSNSYFPAIRNFYVDYFESNGWTRVTLWNEDERFHNGLIDYRKENQTVSLEHIAAVDANYAINCGQDL